MIASLRLIAVLAGVGVGGLATSLVALALSAVFTALDVTDAPDAALIAGLVVGLLAAGYAAGRMAPAFARFHGMVTGLGVAALVVVISKMGGSPAPTPQVLLLAAIGIAVGGIGGVIGGRRDR